MKVKASIMDMFATLSALRVFRSPAKYFTSEQLAEAYNIFVQTWDGNIIRSAQKFVVFRY